MRKILSILGAALLGLSLPLSGNAAEDQRFSDVPSTKHFAEAVNHLAERNIIGGYPDGTFKPGESITRGQAAAIIAKMTKLDMTTVTNPGFKDVSTANGYYKAIAALSEKGVINGYGDGRFGPNDNITRGQMASILIKAFELPLYKEPWNPDYTNSFKDLNYRNSHRAGVYSLYQLNLTTGTTPTTYSPNAPVTRGQAAKLLKASEEVKAEIKVLHPEDYGGHEITNVSTTAPDVLDAITHYKKNTLYETDMVLHLVPKKEGTATLSFSVDEKAHKNYTVQVKKVNGAFQVLLDEANGPFAVPLELWMKDEIKKEDRPSIGANSISLKTVEGKTVNGNMSFNSCTNPIKQYCHVVQIDLDGDFIATVRYADGTETLYSIHSVLDESQSFYTVSSHVINHHYMDVTVDEGNKNLGEPILPNGYEKIATVKRMNGTNTFRITPKKAGNFWVRFPSRMWTPDDPLDGRVQFGILVVVEQIGPHLHIEAEETVEY
ncbi:S-layer homology domain-containing protein [Sporosarcina sp. PTS2304]|uniref:S-layer homology domain-containing protein n=1 Tax=Sporosarcina sp. PTS2304 TaxID=2283194 RepID=UPI000E0D3740|nr:S-layer homology domain-containing protein [Sporosarcina sp. PTS2304]AXH99791.1 S-layer homology domain-containing protein [Sporosarcina sp. PTS2304]